MSGLIRMSEAATLAVHAMAFLATRHDQRFTGQAIAERLAASSHHLAKVMQRLAKAGLVASQRGPNGGFSLGRPPEEIPLLRIYEVVEGPVSVGCLLNKPVCGRQGCVLGGLVQTLHEQIRECLATTSLAAFSEGLAFESPPQSVPA
jgi:Rrf2 family transcriptional regulator, nitric oxide-sensitive transcriptional repressor